MSKKKKSKKPGTYTAPTSGLYAINSTLTFNDGAGGVITLPEGYTIHAPPTHFKCSACKKEKKIDRIGHKYWGPKVERIICLTCYAKRMDKLFATKMNAELEETLYED